jgi:hypothetical protein
MSSTPVASSGAFGTYVDAVQAWLRAHKANLDSSKAMADKVKYVAGDGYVWMLAALLYALFMLYQKEKGKLPRNLEAR